MALSPLSGISPATIPTPRTSTKSSFEQVMKQGVQPPASPPRAVVPPGTTSLTASAPRSPPSPGVVATQALERVTQAQHRMDHVLALAQSGRSFNAAELISLQTNVYRASQELDLAGKVVEKATGSVKQVLQTQL